MTDVLTGWTFTRSIRNNAEKHIISALDAAVGCVPFPVLGMDFVGGSEFINHSVVRWAGDLDIYSRPLTPLQEERRFEQNHLYSKRISCLESSCRITEVQGCVTD